MDVECDILVYTNNGWPGRQNNHQETWSVLRHAMGDVAFARPVLATGIWFHALLGQLPVKYIVKHSIDDASVGERKDTASSTAGFTRRTWDSEYRGFSSLER
jgi:hypothetical protein